jgi:hypothetical protein
MIDIILGLIFLTISIYGLRYYYKIRHEKSDHPSANVAKPQIAFFSILGIIVSLLLFLRGFGIE